MSRMMYGTRVSVCGCGVTISPPLSLSLPVSLRALQQEVFDHAKQWLEALPIFARVSQL